MDFSGESRHHPTIFRFGLGNPTTWIGDGSGCPGLRSPAVPETPTTPYYPLSRAPCVVSATPKLRLVTALDFLGHPFRSLSACRKTAYRLISINPVSFPAVINMTSAVAAVTAAAKKYVPRGRNELHRIYERHFVDFCNLYDEKYAETYGMFRLERFQRLGERFATCGDYLQSIARVRCTNFTL